MTPRQRRILALVHDTIAETGVPPSLMELAASTGVTHGAICRHVQALEAAGYLRRAGGPGSVRQLEVLRLPGRELLADEIAWCHANPARVRAMMRLTDDTAAAAAIVPRASPSRSPGVSPSPSLGLREVVAAARVSLAAVPSGGSVEIVLPVLPQERRRAILDVRRYARRLWGTGEMVSWLTAKSLRVFRAAALPR